MTKRRFALRCAECGRKTMVIATVPYFIRIDHDGKKYEVNIPRLTVPQCTECKAISIDDEASAQIDGEFRRTAKLLTPDEIRTERIRLGYDQQRDFAQAFGIGISTLSRWETGAQVQQHFHDKMLRAFFAVPQMRKYLESLNGVGTRAASTGISYTVITTLWHSPSQRAVSQSAAGTRQTEAQPALPPGR